MKAILILSTSVAFVASIFVCGVAASNYLLEEQVPHHFDHLDAPLWTSKPVVIDPAKQDYERLPAALAAADVPASDLPPDAVLRDKATVAEAPGTDQPTVQPTVQAAAGLQPARAATDMAQVNWCSARYKSYDPASNSYQPFDGGPRKPCLMPGTIGQGQVSAAAAGLANGTEIAMATPTRVSASPDGDQVAASGNGIEETATDNQGMAASDAAAGSHTQWCMARYRSYRADDNSYQPFDGGPRKSCASPFG